MEIFPAIDLIDGCVVRLVRGDYEQKTVYSKDPVSTACDFAAAGARYLHVVDLDGARDGGTPNIETVKEIVAASGLSVEVGGGIRSEETIENYLDAGVLRVILGTAALEDREFLKNAVADYGWRIAVGVDVKDGMVAIKGWREVTGTDCFSFCEELEKIGVSTVICTDISKDGLLAGTNMELYKELVKRFSMDITASGGISTTDDIRKLKSLGLYGAILGKALYTGAIDLKDALMEAAEI